MRLVRRMSGIALAMGLGTGGLLAATVPTAQAAAPKPQTFGYVGKGEIDRSNGRQTSAGSPPKLRGAMAPNVCRACSSK